jgi:hypothetical protein
MSQTCYIVTAFHLYVDCIIPYTASTAIVPPTSILYESVFSILPSVGPYPSTIVLLSMRAMIHPWQPFSFSTNPSLAVRRSMSEVVVLNMS